MKTISHYKNALEITPNKRALRTAKLGLGSKARLVVFEASNQLKWIAEGLGKI
jgi:hypothetical protein